MLQLFYTQSTNGYNLVKCDISSFSKTKKIECLQSVVEELQIYGLTYIDDVEHSSVETQQEHYALEMEELDFYVAQFFCSSMGCMNGGECLTLDLSNEQIETGVDVMAQKMIQILNTQLATDTDQLQDEVDSVLDNGQGSFGLGANQILKLEGYLLKFEELLSEVQDEDTINDVLTEVAPDFVYCSCYQGLTGARCDACSA
uniref:uncharacterized protein LOC120326951 n=1 Tax=Styela clava TaxID=7725 RepID=UPI001939FEF3|nr:uncharacterized protein LOC120326951 [Styela clava]